MNLFSYSYFQVAVLLVLRDKNTQEEICIATTHLKARNGALLSTLRNEQGKLCSIIIIDRTK